VPQVEPITDKVYTDPERALIAGYLIHMRAGTLQALHSTGHPKLGSTDGWGEGTFRYYQDCERYSRFLLHWIGYDVQRGKNYGEE